ncbi:hypothetical protein GQ42DRAFT_176454 [Ramicandelaber brevisporus]|nr:hypothetical protein GQ42DRAFT_176454 [Ramicandelaber brevisporus]
MVVDFSYIQARNLFDSDTPSVTSSALLESSGFYSASNSHSNSNSNNHHSNSSNNNSSSSSSNQMSSAAGAIPNAPSLSVVAPFLDMEPTPQQHQISAPPQLYAASSSSNQNSSSIFTRLASQMPGGGGSSASASASTITIGGGSVSVSGSASASGIRRSDKTANNTLIRSSGLPHPVMGDLMHQHGGSTHASNGIMKIQSHQPYQSSALASTSSTPSMRQITLVIRYVAKDLWKELRFPPGITVIQARDMSILKCSLWSNFTATNDLLPESARVSQLPVSALDGGGGGSGGGGGGDSSIYGAGIMPTANGTNGNSNTIDLAAFREQFGMFWAAGGHWLDNNRTLTSYPLRDKDVVELQNLSSFVYLPLKTYNDHYAEGHINKLHADEQGSSNWQLRWMVIRGHLISLFKNRDNITSAAEIELDLSQPFQILQQPPSSASLAASLAAVTSRQSNGLGELRNASSTSVNTIKSSRSSGKSSISSSASSSVSNTGIIVIQVDGNSVQLRPLGPSEFEQWRRILRAVQATVNKKFHSKPAIPAATAQSAAPSISDTEHSSTTDPPASIVTEHEGTTQQQPVVETPASVPEPTPEPASIPHRRNLSHNLAIALASKSGSIRSTSNSDSVSDSSFARDLQARAREILLPQNDDDMVGLHDIVTSSPSATNTHSPAPERLSFASSSPSSGSMVYSATGASTNGPISLPLSSSVNTPTSLVPPSLFRRGSLKAAIPSFASAKSSAVANSAIVNTNTSGYLGQSIVVGSTTSFISMRRNSCIPAVAPQNTSIANNDSNSSSNSNNTSMFRRKEGIVHHRQNGIAIGQRYQKRTMKLEGNRLQIYKSKNAGSGEVSARRQTPITAPQSPGDAIRLIAASDAIINSNSGKSSPVAIIEISKKENDKMHLLQVHLVSISSKVSHATAPAPLPVSTKHLETSVGYTPVDDAASLSSRTLTHQSIDEHHLNGDDSTNRELRHAKSVPLSSVLSASLAVIDESPRIEPSLSENDGLKAIDSIRDDLSDIDVLTSGRSFASSGAESVNAEQQARPGGLFESIAPYRRRQNSCASTEPAQSAVLTSSVAASLGSSHSYGCVIVPCSDRSLPLTPGVIADASTTGSHRSSTSEAITAYAAVLSELASIVYSGHEAAVKVYIFDSEELQSWKESFVSIAGVPVLDRTSSTLMVPLAPHSRSISQQQPQQQPQPQPQYHHQQQQISQQKQKLHREDNVGGSTVSLVAATPLTAAVNMNSATRSASSGSSAVPLTAAHYGLTAGLSGHISGRNTPVTPTSTTHPSTSGFNFWSRRPSAAAVAAVTTTAAATHTAYETFVPHSPTNMSQSSAIVSAPSKRPSNLFGMSLGNYNNTSAVALISNSKHTDHSIQHVSKFPPHPAVAPKTLSSSNKNIDH